MSDSRRNVLLAALDDSAAARPVLDAARHLAAFVHADVQAVHVREESDGTTAALLTDAAGVPCLVRDGRDCDVVRALDEARRELHALAIVAGARGVPSAARPLGHVALRLVQETGAPVVIVPPLAAGRELRRVMVAVEGDGESEALVALIEQLDDAPTPEVVALHVFAPEELPLFDDEPLHEREAWSSEFLRRATSAPDGRVRLELRVGNVIDEVRAAADDLDVDLVVMGWHGTLGGGHGRVVQRTLESSTVPLLLLPIGSRASAYSDG